MKYKYIYGVRSSGKNYKFIIDISKIISKTYKIPFNVVIEELLKKFEEEKEVKERAKKLQKTRSKV